VRLPCLSLFQQEPDELIRDDNNFAFGIVVVQLYIHQIYTLLLRMILTIVASKVDNLISKSANRIRVLTRN
jgi:hypothetical protein